jgi:hypothetical protein
MLPLFTAHSALDLQASAVFCVALEFSLRAICSKTYSVCSMRLFVCKSDKLQDFTSAVCCSSLQTKPSTVRILAWRLAAIGYGFLYILLCSACIFNL